MNSVLETPAAEGSPPEATEPSGNLSAASLAAMLTADRTPSPAPTPDNNQAPPATPATAPAGGEVTDNPKPGDAPAEPPGSPDGEDLNGGEGKEGRGIARMQERIDEVTAKRREAERERDELKAKLAAVEGKAAPETAPAKPAAQPAANGVHPELAPIVERQTEAERIMDWAAANADGGQVGDREFSRVEVAKLLVNAQKAYSAATAELTTAQARLQAHGQSEQARLDAEAMQVYPWHGQLDSPERKLAEQIIRERPYILQLPDRGMVLGDLVTGRLAREGKAAPAAPKAPPPPDPSITLKPKPKANGTPPPIAAGGTSRVAGDPADKAVQQAREKYEQTGSKEDLAAYQTAVAKAQRSRT